MICANAACGNEIADNSRFCMYCGTAIIPNTKPCPWCLAQQPLDAGYCSNCGNPVAALVLTSTELSELRALFARGGCETNINRLQNRSLQALPLLPSETILAVVARGNAGVFGLFDRGNNCFGDLKVNGKLTHTGPISTVITNCAIRFIEPNVHIAYSQLRGWQTEAKSIQLKTDDAVFDFSAFLTTTTNAFFGVMQAIAAKDDYEQRRKIEQNRDKALSFHSAYIELLQTISDRWNTPQLYG